MTRRIAIVPARGGSKRIPDKNIRDFCGRPIIAYILEAAKESGLFDTIHVSTESSRIQSVVERLGFPVCFQRPSELADDHTPLMPVLKYVVEAFRERDKCFDQVCLLMPCAPLVEAADLKAAANIFDNVRGTRSVLSVASYPVPVEWAFSKKDSGELSPVQPGMFAVRSQDLAVKYYDTGSFAFFPTERVLASNGAGDDTGFVGYVLPKYKAVDIDDVEDWVFAERLFRNQYLSTS